MDRDQTIKDTTGSNSVINKIGTRDTLQEFTKSNIKTTSVFKAMEK